MWEKERKVKCLKSVQYESLLDAGGSQMSNAMVAFQGLQALSDQRGLFQMYFIDFVR
jgi:hypothetical protein